MKTTIIVDDNVVDCLIDMYHDHHDSTVLLRQNIEVNNGKYYLAYYRIKFSCENQIELLLICIDDECCHLLRFNSDQAESFGFPIKDSDPDVRLKFDIWKATTFQQALS